LSIVKPILDEFMSSLFGGGQKTPKKAPDMWDAPLAGVGPGRVEDRRRVGKPYDIYSRNPKLQSPSTSTSIPASWFKGMKPPDWSPQPAESLAAQAGSEEQRRDVYNRIMYGSAFPVPRNLRSGGDVADLSGAIN
jgi:hypothetical protein